MSIQDFSSLGCRCLRWDAVMPGLSYVMLSRAINSISRLRFSLPAVESPARYTAIHQITPQLGRHDSDPIT